VVVGVEEGSGGEALSAGGGGRETVHARVRTLLASKGVVIVEASRAGFPASGSIEKELCGARGGFICSQAARALGLVSLAGGAGELAANPEV
jgi:hypothetical protein